MPTTIKLKRRIGTDKSVYEEYPNIVLSAGEPLFDDVGGILYIGTGSDNIEDLYESGKYFIRGVDEVIVSRMLSASAVTTDKINNAAVTTAKIANSAVTADKIGSSAVTTAKVANSAITLAKLDTTGDTIPASITTIPAYIDKKISDAVQGGVPVTAQNLVITEDGANKIIMSANRAGASNSKALGDVILSGFNLGQYSVTGRTSGTDYTASDITVVSTFKATNSHTTGTLGTQSFYIDTFSEDVKAPFWISANKFSVRKLDGVMVATDPSIVFTGSQGNVAVTDSSGTLTTVSKLSAEAFITGGDTSKVLIGGANGVAWKTISSLVPDKSSYADSAGRVSNTLTIGSTTYDGSNAVAIEATDANTPNALVKRDSNGNFSAGTITASLLKGTALRADSSSYAQRAGKVEMGSLQKTVDDEYSIESTDPDWTYAGLYICQVRNSNYSLALCTVPLLILDDTKDVEVPCAYYKDGGSYEIKGGIRYDSDTKNIYTTDSRLEIVGVYYIKAW